MSYQQQEEISAVYYYGPDGPSVRYVAGNRQYQAFTRRAPRSYTHQLSRTLVDITRFVISLGILLTVAGSLLWVVFKVFTSLPRELYSWLGEIALSAGAGIFILAVLGWVMGDD